MAIKKINIGGNPSWVSKFAETPYNITDNNITGSTFDCLNPGIIENGVPFDLNNPEENVLTSTLFNSLFAIAFYQIGRCQPFTSQTLPDVSEYKYRLIFVEDLSCLAFSDGTNWKKITFGGNI